MFIGEVREVGTIEPLVMPSVLPEAIEPGTPEPPAPEPALEPVKIG